MYSGIIIKVAIISSNKLKKNLPKNISFGAAINLRVSAVWDSSSFKKTWAKPDIEVKKMMIHNKAAWIFEFIGKLPMEKETAVRVTTANNKIEFTAAFERASCFMSFRKIVNILNPKLNHLICKL